MYRYGARVPGVLQTEALQLPKNNEMDTSLLAFGFIQTSVSKGKKPPTDLKH